MLHLTIYELNLRTKYEEARAKAEDARARAEEAISARG